MNSRFLPETGADVEALKLLDGAGILVTGGTGSFGQTFVRRINEIAKPRPLGHLFARRAQAIRDGSSISARHAHAACASSSATCAIASGWNWRCATSTTSIHAAALKQVPTAEYNPFECIQHQRARRRERRAARAIATGVKRVIALSTDKAANPINLYGATQACVRQDLRRRQPSVAARPTRASPWCATATSSARAAAWFRSSAS